MEENETTLVDIMCKTFGMSKRILFPEIYMNDEEKQEYIEGYINWFKNWVKNILEEGE